MTQAISRFTASESLQGGTWEYALKKIISEIYSHSIKFLMLSEYFLWF